MDHLHFLLDAPATSIAEWGRTTRPEFARDNLNGAVIAFVGGHRARVDIGWFLPAFPPSEWLIVGPNGIAWFDQVTATVSLAAGDRSESVELGEEWIPACFREQLAVFLTGVRTRCAPWPGVDDAIASMALCQQCERSLAGPMTDVEVRYP